jgi:hypothetical protein
VDIFCDPKAGGCGGVVAVTPLLAEQMRRAAGRCSVIPCPNPLCSRIISVGALRSILAAVDAAHIGLDPKAVPVASSLAAIGAVGVLDADDLAELNAGTRRVASLMADGLWHDAEEIRVAAGEPGQPATEGLRRLRELRKLRGAALERRAVSGTRNFVYRLKLGADT